MKLTPAAADLLRTDYEGFIRRHGTYYVAAITYGGSFLGSYTMNAKSSSSANDLATEASFSYDKGLFSADGSAEFEKKEAKLRETLDVKGDFQALPSPPNAGTPASPLALNSTYMAWRSIIDSNSADCPLDEPCQSALYGNIARHIDSPEVQAIVNTLPESAQRYFVERQDVSQTVIDAAGLERINTDLLLKSIERYESWPEVAADQSLREKYTRIKYGVQGHLDKLQSDLDGISLLVLRDEFHQRGDDIYNGVPEPWLATPRQKWLLYDVFEQEYQELKQLIEADPSLNPWKKLGTMGDFAELYDDCRNSDWRTGYGSGMCSHMKTHYGFQAGFLLYSQATGNTVFQMRSPNGRSVYINRDMSIDLVL